MERINNRKYAVTSNDFGLIGAEIEPTLEAIKKHEYGSFNLAKFDLKTQLAMRIIEGMSGWQQENNIGIKIHGDTNVRVDFYDLAELQKRIDTMMEIDPYTFD